MSEGRAAWMIEWYETLLRDRKVKTGRLREGLGRAGFVYGALEWERPFLSPLYSFANLHSSHTTQVIPLHALMVLRYLATRLKACRSYPCAEKVRSWDTAPRVDAGARGLQVGIGLWEPALAQDGSINKWESRWFMIELDKESAPWVYDRDDQPFRVISALEGIATLFSFMAFGPKEADGYTNIVLPGLTDNEGCSHALSKLQTSKFPLNLVTMELAAQTARMGCRLQLEWTPRESNVEADALSNGDATGFNPEKRIPVSMDGGGWMILPEFMGEARKWDKEVRLLRAKGTRRLGKEPKKARHDTLRVRDPWPT